MPEHHEPIDPTYHILDSDFVGQNAGLTPPDRNIGASPSAVPVIRSPSDNANTSTVTVASHGLMISNLDRDDPPGYTAGDYPRSSEFNRNVFNVTIEPRMPQIPVACSIAGFDPLTTPICWRLQCLYIVGRHVKRDGFRYASHTARVQVEWQGRARRNNFVLFDPEPATASSVKFDHWHDTAILGGHAILSVAAQPPGASGPPLLDYVHLRILGTNPPEPDIANWVDTLVPDRHEKIRLMMMASFYGESHLHQFLTDSYSRRYADFGAKHHEGFTHQPNCRTYFEVPIDGVALPKVDFDWGVGISQWTIDGGPTRPVTPDITWNWRSNTRAGVSRMIDAIRDSWRLEPRTWQQWALASWVAYNQGTLARTSDHAQRILRESSYAAQIGEDPIPADLDLTVQTRGLQHTADSRQSHAPPAWPPTGATSDW